MFVYVPGHLCPVAFQFNPLAGGTVTLGIKEHSYDEERVRYDVSSSATQGHTARLAGKLDIKGTVLADLDLETGGSPASVVTPPWALAVNLNTGQNGFLILNYSGQPNANHIVPCIVAKVHFQMRHDFQIQYSFDYEYNVLALQSASQRANGQFNLAVRPDGRVP